MVNNNQKDSSLAQWPEAAQTLMALMHAQGEVARLSERESRPLPNAVGPVEGPTEPQLIAVEPDRSRKTAPDQG